MIAPAIVARAVLAVIVVEVRLLSADVIHYVPLSGPRYSPGLGMDFWDIGLSVAEVAARGAAAEMIVGVLRMRAPGMSLARLPMFAWSMLVTGVMIVFAFTPLIVGAAMLELDRKGLTRFFDLEAGGNPLLWQHIFWIFGHPEVYIMFVPAVGIVSQAVGRWSFWLMFVFFHVTFFPMHVVGLLGMPRRVGGHAAGLGWMPYNAVSTGGGVRVRGRRPPLPRQPGLESAPRSAGRAEPVGGRYARVERILAVGSSPCSWPRCWTASRSRWPSVPGIRFTTGRPARSREAIARYGCTGCHAVPGLHAVRGRAGPSREALGRRRFLAGHLVNDPPTLVASIRDPRALDPRTAMPPLGVSERDAPDIAADLYGASGG